MTARAVVLSIDFELRWGVADAIPDRPDAYQRNLEAVPDAVEASLEIFAAHDAGATWATVGAVACEGWDDYHARAPRPPRYRDVRLRFRSAFRLLDPRGRLHFAPGVVRRIASSPRQEIASHTFGHIYFREPGCELSDVEQDTRAAAEVLRDRTESPVTSFVFPRNQIACTDVLRSAGIRRWRTNPRPFFWSATSSQEQSSLVRVLRVADSVLPMGHRGAAAGEHRASHFVRFALPEIAWRAHLRRLVEDARALGPGEHLHLWWHPHNLGAPLLRSLARLEDLLTRVRDAAPDLPILSMVEADARDAPGGPISR